MRKIIIYALAALSVIFAGASLKSMADLRGSHASYPSLGQTLNSQILRRMTQYPNDGSARQLPRDLFGISNGTTHDIRFMGDLLWEGDPEGRSYCSGLMFEVYLDACADCASEESGKPDFRLPGVDLNNIRQFQRDFYGANGDQKTMVAALVKHGLGVEIGDLDQAQPGDLVQLWINGGSWGHSAVFLGWDRDLQGNRTQVRVWSVQSGCISETRYDVSPGRVSAMDPSRVHIVRALRPALP